MPKVSGYEWDAREGNGTSLRVFLYILSANYINILDFLKIKLNQFEKKTKL